MLITFLIRRSPVNLSSQCVSIKNVYNLNQRTATIVTETNNIYSTEGLLKCNCGSRLTGTCRNNNNSKYICEHTGFARFSHSATGVHEAGKRRTVLKSGCVDFSQQLLSVKRSNLAGSVLQRHNFCTDSTNKSTSVIKTRKIMVRIFLLLDHYTQIS